MKKILYSLLTLVIAVQSINITELPTEVLHIIAEYTGDDSSSLACVNKQFNGVVQSLRSHNKLWTFVCSRSGHFYRDMRVVMAGLSLSPNENKLIRFFHAFELSKKLEALDQNLVNLKLDITPGAEHYLSGQLTAFKKLKRLWIQANLNYIHPNLNDLKIALNQNGDHPNKLEVKGVPRKSILADDLMSSRLKKLMRLNKQSGNNQWPALVAREKGVIGQEIEEYDAFLATENPLIKLDELIDQLPELEDLTLQPTWNNNFKYRFKGKVEIASLNTFLKEHKASSLRNFNPAGSVKNALENLPLAVEKREVIR